MLLTVAKNPTEMRLVHLNEKFEQQQVQFSELIHQKDEKKSLQKRMTDDQKTRERNNFRTFVLDFKGDMNASGVNTLREEITAILSMARKGVDHAIIRLESPGGLVHGYGLAAAQLVRLREAGIHLTVCIDKVAASGGYMMACVADKVVSAPFAVLGSIGVVAQLPNFHKLLEHLKIDFDVYTAGQFKRTVTMFGENTEQGKEKFAAELEQTHQLFKRFVNKYRPKLSVDVVSTGEHWYGEDALQLHLADELSTSDDYIVRQFAQRDVYLMYSRKKPTLADKIGIQASTVVHQSLNGALAFAERWVSKSRFNVL